MVENNDQEELRNEFNINSKERTITASNRGTIYLGLVLTLIAVTCS